MYVIYWLEQRHTVLTKHEKFATGHTKTNENLKTINYGIRLYHTRIYDKDDDFNVLIVNFPFLSSYIPSAQSYGIYMSQSTQKRPVCLDL